jgi:hypothetical protein
MLANIRTEASCSRKVIRNSGQTYLCNHLPKIFGDSFILVYTYCQELMKPVVSNGRLSLLFNVKVMV